MEGFNMYKKGIISKIVVIALILAMNSVVFASENVEKKVISEDIHVTIEGREVLAANETANKSELELELELKYPSDLDFEQNYIQKNILKSHNVTPDEAAKAVEDEEDYIVNLINSLLDENNMTDLSNWEYNLQFLENNYDEIVNIEDVNIFYVDSYIEAYTFVKLSKDMPETSVENENDPTITPFFSKSFSDKVKEYAKKYYKNPNKTDYVFFPDVNSSYYDCANFASQCIKYAGKSMEGSKGENEDFSKWFSYGNTFVEKNISSTWRGADAFKWYWSSKVNYDTFTSMNSDASNKDFLIAQHSGKNGGQYEEPLKNKSFSKIRIYTMS